MAEKSTKGATRRSNESSSARLAANVTTDPRRQKALEAAMEQIERHFGKGAIMRFGQSELEDIEFIPTGSLSLDLALGIGGLPMGRIIEIYGPESSGKTTLTLELLAQAQKLDKVCAFIDAEHALDPLYARKLGVKIEDVFISQPDNGEQALEICETLVRSGGVDVIIVDSVAALVPRAEIEGDMGDNHVGLQARLMSQALRKLAGTIKQANAMVVFINQLRMKIGVMFGNPETTTGGNALKYYASVRLDIRKGAAIKDREEIIGSETRVKVVKNKVAPPFKQANFQILFNYGIARSGELVDLGVQAGVIEKSGAWFAYNGTNFAQGKVNAMRYLDDNPEIADDVERRIREYFMQNSDYTATAQLGGADAAARDQSGDPRFEELDDDELISQIPDDL